MSCHSASFSSSLDQEDSSHGPFKETCKTKESVEFNRRFSDFVFTRDTAEKPLSGIPLETGIVKPILAKISKD